MPSEFFGRLFDGLPSRAELLIWQGWLKHLVDTDKAERTAAGRLVDWYNRDREKIVEHLKEAAKKTFPGGETDNWQFPTINGVPRIINRISMDYKQPPERSYFRGDKKLDSNSKETILINGMYRNIDLDHKFKEMNRYRNLLNTIHIEVVPRKGAIDWDIRLRPSVSIVEDPDDYLNFVKFAYRWGPMDPDTLRVRWGWVYWDEERYTFILDNGMEYPMIEDDEEGLNPYGGVIPIVTVRKLEQDDYWGRYGADLVDGFEQAHLQIGNTWEISFLQTHGQPVATNCGFKDASNIKVGPGHPICAENVTKEDVAPSLKFAHPDSDIDKALDLVDWYMNYMSSTYGLAPGAWSMKEVPESGFAKFMNNIEQYENREEGIPQWVKIEKELFETSRMVWNRWASANGEKEIPDDIELQVEFPPVIFPEAPLDKEKRYMIMFKNGTSSPVEYFMKEEHLDESAAMEKAKRIAAQIKEVREAGASEMSLPELPGKEKSNEGNEE